VRTEQNVSSNFNVLKWQYCTWSFLWNRGVYVADR